MVRGKNEIVVAGKKQRLLAPGGIAPGSRVKALPGETN